MPARFFSPKQRRLVFSLLRKKGLLKKLAASRPKSPGLNPSAWIPRSTVSGRHVADFKSLLDKGDTPQVALDKIRYGGMLPKLSTTDNAYVRSVIKKKLSLPDTIFDEFEKMDPKMLPLLSRHNSRVRSKVGGLFDDWGSHPSSPGAYRLRQLSAELLGPIPGSRLIRPDVIKRLSVKWKVSPKELRRSFSKGSRDYLLDIYAHNQAILSRKHKGKFIKVYRGLSGAQADLVRSEIASKGVTSLDADTLSSWTTELSAAPSYGNLVVQAKVHRSRFLASRIDMMGTEEHIIFGDRFWLTKDDIIGGV